MRTLTIILTLTFLFLLTSCDQLYTAEIKNESTRQTLLKIKYDTAELNKIYYIQGITNGITSKRAYIQNLKYRKEKNEILFDTINVIKTIVIKSNETFILQSSLSRPKFDIYENMTLINKDTVHFKSKQEIKNAFKQVDKILWQLIIK